MTDALLPCGITLCPHTVTTLADLHIERFAQMLEVANAGGVNVAESRYYLGLWRTIRASAIDGRELDSEKIANRGVRLCAEQIRIAAAVFVCVSHPPIEHASHSKDPELRRFWEQARERGLAKRRRWVHR